MIKLQVDALILKLKNNPFIMSILKHSPKYLSGSVINAVVSMLMMKYYTAAFSPAEFGVLSLYVVLFQFLQNLIAFSFDGSSQRVYFDAKGDDRREFFGTMLFFMVSSSIFWCIVAFAFQTPLIKVFGGDQWIYWSTFFLSIVYVFFNFLNRIAYNEHLSTLVFRQGLVQTFLNHFLSFIMIQFGKMGILSRQIAQLAAYGINSLFYGFGLKKSGLLEIKWKFSIPLFQKVLHFALPSFITTLLISSLGYLDRFFLNHFFGAKEVGIYSFGFTIGQMVSMVIEAVSLAVFPSMMKLLEKDYKSNLGKLKRFDALFCVGLVFFGILVYFFKDIIVQIFSNNNYSQSGYVIPFIVFAAIMGGFYKNVSNVLTFHKKVWFYPALSVFSFGISGLLNYILIPRFHEIGAAYSNFLGMFIYSLIIQLIGSKYYIRKWLIIIIYSVVFIGIFGLFVLSTQKN